MFVRRRNTKPVTFEARSTCLLPSSSVESRSFRAIGRSSLIVAGRIAFGRQRQHRCSARRDSAHAISTTARWIGVRTASRFRPERSLEVASAVLIVGLLPARRCSRGHRQLLTRTATSSKVGLWSRASTTTYGYHAGAAYDVTERLTAGVGYTT